MNRLISCRRSVRTLERNNGRFAPQSARRLCETKVAHGNRHHSVQYRDFQMEVAEYEGGVFEFESILDRRRRINENQTALD